jgi:6-phosphogluconolactonase
MLLRKLPTRRTFVQALGTMTALGSLSAAVPSASAAIVSFPSRSPQPRFGYIALNDHAISVFSVAQDGAWTQTQTVPSQAPVALLLSPDQQFLYVANSVSTSNHLPTGTVEAYAIDSRTGHLTLLNRRALALFATWPAHLAISPNGSLLAVATSSGFYNLLSLNKDGSLGHVSASLKSIASPLYSRKDVAFRPAMHFAGDDMLFLTDPGNGRFAVNSITQDGALLPRHHTTIPSGGSGHMVAHPNGKDFFVAGTTAPQITNVHLDDGKRPSFPSYSQLMLPDDNAVASLVLHPSGSLLLAATVSGIYVLRITPSRSLEIAAHHRKDVSGPAILIMSSAGAHLFALNQLTGSLIRFNLDAKRAQLSSSTQVASLAAPVAVAISLS